MEILFRADASASMGSGHVMRCLALAEALAEAGHRCHFALAETTPSIARRLAAAAAVAHRIDPAADVRAETTRALARAVRAAALVVDGYHFDAAWRQALRQAGLPVLAFADHGDEPPLHADLVIDAAADPAAPRSHDDGTTWLLGPGYVLLRRELVEAARLPPLEMAARRSVLVTFGGSDPAGLSVPVTAALILRLGAAVPIEVVVGGSVPAAAAVAAAVAALGPQVRVQRDPPALGGLMRESGLAVSAAGGTIGELAALSVPAVIAVIADNQERGAAMAVAAGWCEALDARRPGAAEHLAARAAALWRDPAERARRALTARRAVDAGGAARLAAALIERALAKG